MLTRQLCDLATSCVLTSWQSVHQSVGSTKCRASRRRPSRYHSGSALSRVKTNEDNIFALLLSPTSCARTALSVAGHYIFLLPCFFLSPLSSPQPDVRPNCETCYRHSLFFNAVRNLCISSMIRLTRETALLLPGGEYMVSVSSGIAVNSTATHNTSLSENHKVREMRILFSFLVLPKVMRMSLFEIEPLPPLICPFNSDVFGHVLFRFIETPIMTCMHIGRAQRNAGDSRFRPKRLINNRSGKTIVRPIESERIDRHDRRHYY